MVFAIREALSTHGFEAICLTLPEDPHDGYLADTRHQARRISHAKRSKAFVLVDSNFPKLSGSGQTCLVELGAAVASGVPVFWNDQRGASRFPVDALASGRGDDGHMLYSLARWARELEAGGKVADIGRYDEPLSYWRPC